MKWKPTGTKVLVKLQETDTESDGGFMLSERAQKQMPIGIVEAVGKGLPNEPMLFSPGDKVTFQPHSNSRITEDGTEYIFVEQNDIVGVEGE